MLLQQSDCRGRGQPGGSSGEDPGRAEALFPVSHTCRLPSQAGGHQTEGETLSGFACFCFVLFLKKNKAGQDMGLVDFTGSHDFDVYIFQCFCKARLVNLFYHVRSACHFVPCSKGLKIPHNYSHLHYELLFTLCCSCH